jgi:hypothetical protein
MGVAVGIWAGRRQIREALDHQDILSDRRGCGDEGEVFVCRQAPLHEARLDGRIWKPMLSVQSSAKSSIAIGSDER